MIRQKLLTGLLLSSTFSYASSLSVYQDMTFYIYESSTNFIGFTKGVRAKCEGKSVALLSSMSCPSDNRLCTLITELNDTKKELSSVRFNEEVLKTFISLPKPEVIDASAWIVSAQLIGKEQASLLDRKDVLQKRFKENEKFIQRQAPSMWGEKIQNVCQGELELSIPYGQVSFSTHYLADVSQNEITVTQNLHIINRSGIDIQANTAMFYYRRANQHVNAIHFSPWIVSKYAPQQKRMYHKKRLNASAMKEASVDFLPAEAADVMPASIVSYEDAREYKITNLSLLSTGIPTEVTVQTWKSDTSCELKAYPYVSLKAFEVCSFKPKYQIDTNSWKIKFNGKIINERAIGEYGEDGTYKLYTKIDEDIKIVRTPIVKNERETGIFGGTARKKDGFILNVTNKSDKVKTLTLIERIPTSTTQEIKVKLLLVKSKTKIAYKLLKDGKLEINITLNAHETKKIEVLFEISYDKDVKVSY